MDDRGERRTLSERVQNLLDEYKQGRVDAAEAQAGLMRLVYEEGPGLLLDVHRRRRTAFPEVVYAPGKTTRQVIDAAAGLLGENPFVFVWGADGSQEAELRKRFAGMEVRRENRLLLVGRNEAGTGTGCAGIITAGTSDIPYAKECSLMLETLGYGVITALDMGAAGMHRPLIGLEKARDADVLVVFAGMDGVLPTLVASLTDRPVVAVPTPVGYGYGGAGHAALGTMLQCCVPGVVVVNIGNSVGAAAAAVRILNAVRRAAGGMGG
ncbi:MAG TPA: nickel pincer cofactor biosynthesis protein LarB [Deltaproteobacteria bacterium]|nr:nickel pincer cofactor biosynthesis protein LarB [Deltaproteobacteria bacterium]HOM28113.1 nickel pincer cofactor biosynthesis protein LarB [Deltaproteobacteria bacterium]HPP81398.1 nickel pincer cofactor biosynthesis protein LarB [Deltaproteobacteria bacterium]